MEEYVLSSLSLPSIPMRQFLVTSGSRVISRASNDSFSIQVNSEETKLHKGAQPESSDTVFGVPLLPDIGSLEPSKHMKPKTRKEQSRNLNSSRKMGDGKHFHLPDGSTDSMLLFCLGICIGVISSVIANRREVYKLKELLKQTENLVQDLQEELEMKDLLTVKELANENFESRDKCDCSLHGSAPNAHFLEQNMDSSKKYDGKESYNQKTEESLESMSKIEAELEAELERLGLNINTSTKQRRLSDRLEIDPDFVTDFAQGELRANMVSREAVDESHLDRYTSSTCTSQSANYAVSPRELSLRLHEVIQARLEERVEELETTLQNSQRKVQLMESENKSPRREFSNSKLIYSATEENPIAKAEVNSVAQPLVMNLSGEALDAYNEAYEELMKMSQSEEEDSPSGVHDNHDPEDVNQFDKSMFGGLNGGLNGLMLHIENDKVPTSSALFPCNARTAEEAISRVEEFNDASINGDESNDYGDDESEKLLIKQIVEKTKRGSPVVLNAQMLLFSMDENEN